jgi:hypothetical protein
MARGIQPLISIENDPTMLSEDEAAVYYERQKNFFNENTLSSYTSFIDRIKKP